MDRRRASPRTARAFVAAYLVLAALLFHQALTRILPTVSANAIFYYGLGRQAEQLVGRLLRRRSESQTA